MVLEGEENIEIKKLKVKEDLRKNEMKTPVTVGYTAESNTPVVLYFNDGYINDRDELSVNSKDWIVYYKGVNIGQVSYDGRIEIDEESYS